MPFAALNRGITDKAKAIKASDAILENLEQDFSVKDPDEPVYHSILFLLAYLDANVSFGVISQRKAEDIMHYLSENYSISIEV